MHDHPDPMVHPRSCQFTRWPTSYVQHVSPQTDSVSPIALVTQQLITHTLYSLVPSVVGHQSLSADLTTSIGHPTICTPWYLSNLLLNHMLTCMTPMRITTGAEPLSSKPICSLPCLSTHSCWWSMIYKKDPPHDGLTTFPLWHTPPWCHRHYHCPWNGVERLGWSWGEKVRERYRTKAPQEVRMSMRLDGLEGTQPIRMAPQDSRGYLTPVSIPAHTHTCGLLTTYQPPILILSHQPVIPIDWHSTHVNLLAVYQSLASHHHHWQWWCLQCKSCSVPNTSRIGQFDMSI